MHAVPGFFGDTGSGDVIVYNPLAFFHTLPVSGSAFLTLAYLPLVLESCEHGGYGHGL